MGFTNQPITVETETGGTENLFFSKEKKTFTPGKS